MSGVSEGSSESESELDSERVSSVTYKYPETIIDHAVVRDASRVLMCGCSKCVRSKVEELDVCASQATNESRQLPPEEHDGDHAVVRDASRPLRSNQKAVVQRMRAFPQATLREPPEVMQL